MRHPFLTIILGYTGTGKTTYEKRIIENYVRKVRNRVLIICPHDVEFTDVPILMPEDIQKPAWWNYEGKRRYIADENILKAITHPKNYFRNGLLVFDDVRFFIKSNIGQDLHQLFIARKQRGIDIIASAHGFTDVPPKFFMFAKYIVLFKTLDNIAKRKNVLNNYENLVSLQQKINKHPDLHYYEIFKMI